MLVGGIAGNAIETHGKETTADGASTPSTGPYITMAEVQALLTQQKASEGSREEPAVAKASALSAEQFITLADVQALLSKEKAKTVLPSLPSSNICPPDLITILSLPYPEGYSPPKFVKFDSKECSALELVVRFIESLGAHRPNSNFHLREFSKFLTSRAYTWYVNLRPNSIATWEEMVNSFYAKFFQVHD